MTERKIIFKCSTGSHLYGTNRPESDEDFQGIFLPSTEDLLGLQSCPNEWTENIKVTEGARNGHGDIDCKYFSLQRFMQLVAQGQPGQLEMLFVPEYQILIASEEYWLLRNNLIFFLSKRGISPFIGFALAQANKAVLKGENLNLITNLIHTLTDFAEQQSNKLGCMQDPISTLFEAVEDSRINIRGVWVKKGKTDSNEDCIEIASRKFNVGLTIKRFLSTLQDMEERYGTRSRAAATRTYDYKSLGHAVRLLGEAKEFLQYGTITLPRPDAEFLKTVLRGTCDTEIDWLTYITEQIDVIKQEIEPTSPLPEQANWSKLNELCQKILTEHLMS